ncbi:MAG: cytochrome c biogenesis CcdA family protein [Promethearchaeota archaeon]
MLIIILQLEEKIFFKMIDIFFFFLAIFGGIISFLTPCNVVTLPSFILYLASQTNTPKKALLMSSFFSLGFILMFSLIATLYIIISGFIRYTFYFKLFSGLTIILLSIYIYFAKQFTRATQILIPPQNHNDDLNELEHNEKENNSNKVDASTFDDELMKYEGYSGSFMLGFSMGFSWIGCLTPIYLSIIIIVSDQADLITGIFLFTCYALGIMIPYILIGASIGKIKQIFFVKLIKIGSKLQKILAIILLYIGIEITLAAFGNPGLLTFI